MPLCDVWWMENIIMNSHQTLLFLLFHSHSGPSMVNGLKGVPISDVTSMGCVQGSKSPFKEQSCEELFRCIIVIILCFTLRFWQSFLGWFYDGVLESGRFSLLRHQKATRNSYVTRSEFGNPFSSFFKKHASPHVHTANKIVPNEFQLTFEGQIISC